MAGQCGVDANVCSFGIAHFTYHYDIWILAQKRAQCRGEGEANGGMHLCLIDGVSRIFQARRARNEDA